MDVNNVFLNGLPQETIYMTQPPRFEVGDRSLVGKLKLYGLKQVSRLLRSEL